MHARLSDPGGPNAPTALAQRTQCCLPLLGKRRLRNAYFEAQSHSLHAPCVRFAVGIAPAPRNTRFRLAA